MSRWDRVAASCLFVTGVAHTVLAIAALANNATFAANVREIESNPNFGKLYFGLGTWGLIVLLLGGAELVGATCLWRGTRNARLFALTIAYFALAGAFFGLAIFRFAALATAVILLFAIYLLSYICKPGD